jgi:hypothetical protein
VGCEGQGVSLYYGSFGPGVPTCVYSCVAVYVRLHGDTMYAQHVFWSCTYTHAHSARTCALMHAGIYLWVFIHMHARVYTHHFHTRM